jgi:hypothetical protein
MIVGVVLALALVAAVPASPASARGLAVREAAPVLLFRAVYAENFPATGCSATHPCVFTTTGVGRAAVLGVVTEQTAVVLAGPAVTPGAAVGCLPLRATTTFTSTATGQTLTASSFGSYCPLQTSVYSATLNVQFTGGTGQFAHANGTGTAQGLVSTATSTGVALWTWTGSISLCPSPACVAAGASDRRT